MAATRRRGLGKGLEALIPTVPVTAEDEAPLSEALHSRQERWKDDPAVPYREIPVELVDPNPRQPRDVFDEQELAELSASIRTVGVLQPVVVRPAGDRYELIMGERRFRASKLAGLRVVPAVVRETADGDLLRDALLENIHRQDLNALEEAAAYEQLLGEFGVTHDELADRLGKSRPAISNALRLLRLPVPVQHRVAAGTLSAGHARAVASLVDPEQQERLASRIVAEGLTVRQAEELARRAALGDGTLSGTSPRPSAHRRIQAPGVDDLAIRLSDRLETRVKVNLGKRKGKVLIEFGSLDDLQRICDVIGLSPDSLQNAVPEGEHTSNDA